MAELEVEIGGEPVLLTDDNTTVFTFRDAKHMDHVFITREEFSTYLFGVPEFVRKLIDLDFPLQSARWPREGDFAAFEGYIDCLAEGFNKEMDEKL